MVNFILSYIRSNLLWSAGRSIAIVLGVAMIGAAFFYMPLFFALIPFAVFSFWFFRNPDRYCQQAQVDKKVIVCPADGRVVNIITDQRFGEYTQRVSIFLSPLDVHVNWAPITGKIEQVQYRPGKFLVAFAPKSSDINERNDVVIRTSGGFSVKVRQIAGFVARRIVCWVDKGESVTVGYKYGMIRFGSRVDIFLPANATIAVSVGQRVYGGQTVLGERI